MEKFTTIIADILANVIILVAFAWCLQVFMKSLYVITYIQSLSALAVIWLISKTVSIAIQK